MQEPKFLNTKQIAEYLGLGLCKTKELCKARPHNFPVVLIGNRYQADTELLRQWKNDWYTGKFSID